MDGRQPNIVLGGRRGGGTHSVGLPNRSQSSVHIVIDNDAMRQIGRVGRTWTQTGRALACAAALAIAAFVLTACGQDSDSATPDIASRDEVSEDAPVESPTDPTAAPTELSMSEYASEMCGTVGPKVEAWVDLRESPTFDRRLREGDINNEAEATEAVDLTRQSFSLFEELNDEIESFSDSHVVTGADGEVIQEGLDSYVADSRTELEVARVRLDDVDPADGREVVDEIGSLRGDFNRSAPSIWDDENDPGYELATTMAEEDADNCALFTL